MFVRTTRFARIACAFALTALAVPAAAQTRPEPRCVFHTNLGDIRVDLLPDAAPKTVANFLQYVRSGAYSSSFIHRSASQFVIQGGGYTVDANAHVSTIPALGPVVGEPGVSNTRGTLAMALSTGPDSGTDEWFFNEEDNSALLDDTSDGGPFTVFGRIADSSSLAVMDAVGALTVYDASNYFGIDALDSLPLVDYGGHAVTQSNFVVLSSITTPYTAASVAAGPDGKTRVLWIRGDGAATVWTLNADGTPASYSPVFGPFAGWTATGLSVGPDNAAHILWNNAGGSMTVWTLPAGSATPTYGTVYGPITGWKATSIATGTSNKTHILWNKSDGSMTLWSLPATGSPTYGPVYGPIAGWTAQAIATGLTSTVHVLWTNTNGAMTLWTFADVASAPTYSPTFGPINGWTALALSVDTGGAAQVLWDNADGRMTLWTIPATGSPVYGTVFGPYAGWTAESVSLGADGNSHVLWNNADGSMTPWTLNTSSQFVGSFPAYGPY